jgi:antitoxin component of RelBE/YafQ-DinJ toxin-antitoxin module
MTTATTLRIDESTYREAKAEAARRGMTVTRFIEEALRQTLSTARTAVAVSDAEIKERDRLMEGLLRATAHFRVGPKPTRDEMNAR